MRRIAPALVCLFLALATWAQETKPRIAVIPFNHVNLSKADAEVVSGLFETGLVKTEIYDVIEQNQIQEILLAQEHSVSDCTDEQCAIRFGKLLAAEQIVLGTLSSLGGTFILNAKIIDVTTGAHVKADKVTTDSLAGMTEAAELLAFKLTGLTYYEGTEETIAREFGEIFVETDPSGAEVYVNGVRKGLSPCLISRVPLGRVIIECRKGNRYARREITISKATTRTTLELQITYGNLFIQSSIKENITVTLGGKVLGDLGSGFFENVPVGQHVLTLKGNGVYWSDTVTIASDESARVEAYPREYGRVDYALPPNTQGVVTGRSFRTVVRGSGTLEPVWIGEYEVEVEGADYRPYHAAFEILRGRAYALRPQLDHTDAYTQARLEESRKAELRTKIDTLQEEVDALAAAKRALEASRRQRVTTGWVSLGTGGSALLFSLLALLMSEQAYDAYVSADTVDAAVGHRQAFQTWDGLTYTAWGLGGLGLGTFAVLRLTGPKQTEILNLEQDIHELDEEISALRGESGWTD